MGSQTVAETEKVEHCWLRLIQRSSIWAHWQESGYHLRFTVLSGYCGFTSLSKGSQGSVMGLFGSEMTRQKVKSHKTSWRCKKTFFVRDEIPRGYMLFLLGWFHHIKTKALKNVAGKSTTYQTVRSHTTSCWKIKPLKKQKRHRERRWRRRSQERDDYWWLLITFALFCTLDNLVEQYVSN